MFFLKVVNHFQAVSYRKFDIGVEFHPSWVRRSRMRTTLKVVPKGRRVVATGGAASVLTMPRNPWHKVALFPRPGGAKEAWFAERGRSMITPPSLRDGRSCFLLTTGSRQSRFTRGYMPWPLRGPMRRHPCRTRPT